MKKSLKILGIMGLLIIALGAFAAGCGKNEEIATDSEAETQTETTDTALYCPLDHDELASVPERVFAVSIDNGAKSEPQTGLSIADIVYELPVEGGITRFLAVFYHNQNDVIGPVRSARHYYIDLVQSMNGIYVHCGSSYIAKEAFAAGEVADIDEMAYGSDFWRDNTRKKPTNLYTSWENLNDIATRNDMPKAEDLKGFSFYSEEELATLSQGSNTTIDIPYTYKPVSYSWDTASSRYLRFSDGSEHIDAASDTQIYADNVVVLHNDATIIDPNGGLLDMSFVNNSGSGYIFQKGNVLPITWSMAGEYSPLVLTGADGAEAKLVPGKTFVQVIINDMAVDYDGSAEAPAE
ncbi:MAG: DUF3048 domain-containing protein [Bacillota bacterium]|nr:DUF3048 domain-containing protein [Bacillota bacterium]